MLAFVGSEFGEEDVDYDPMLDLDSVCDVMEDLWKDVQGW